MRRRIPRAGRCEPSLGWAVSGWTETLLVVSASRCDFVTAAWGRPVWCQWPGAGVRSPVEGSEYVMSRAALPCLGGGGVD